MRRFDFTYRDQEHCLWLHDNDQLSDSIVREGGYYERQILETIEAWGPYRTVVDVGANLGNHSVYAMRVWGASVVAIEPCPENLELLKKNFGRPRKEARIYPFALGAETCTCTPVFDTTNSGCSYVVPGGGTVEIHRLDDLGLEEVDLLKIDVEGHELQVLKGGVATLNLRRPRLLIEGELEPLASFLYPLNYRLARSWASVHTHFFVPC